MGQTAMSGRGGHLLIVGGGGAAHPLLRRTFGGPASVFCSIDLLPGLQGQGNDVLVAGFAAEASDAHWLAAADMLNSWRPVSHIAALGDRDQDRYALIAQRLGLPGPAPQTIAWMQDKAAMRRRLAEMGVDDCPCFVVADIAELRSSVAALGLPVVCKPKAGVASRGVSLITDLGQLEHAFAHGRGGTLAGEGTTAALPSPQLMVEPFLPGTEYSVDTLSEGGVHRCVCLAEKTSDPEHFVELRHVLPAPLPASARNGIERKVCEMLTALGVTDGVCHTEVKLDGEHVRIIESHHRPGGDEIPHMFHDLTGIDLFALRARQCCGETVMAELDAALRREREQAYGCIQFAAVRSPGVLRAVEGLAEARAMPGVVRARALLSPGHQLTGAFHSGTRAALVRAVGNSPALARERAAAAMAQVRIVVEACPQPVNDQV